MNSYGTSSLSSSSRTPRASPLGQLNRLAPPNRSQSADQRILEQAINATDPPDAPQTLVKDVLSVVAIVVGLATLVPWAWRSWLRFKQRTVGMEIKAG